jgi:hypothetical protein
VTAAGNIAIKCWFLRYMRIAFSATCLIACVLLIVLWVRSYVTTDLVRLRNTKYSFDYLSSYGEIGIGVSTARSWRTPGTQAYSRLTFPYMNSWQPDARHPYLSLLGFRLGPYLLVYHTESIVHVVFPFWFALLIIASLGAAPHAPWSKRFSLRTLLIATTLVAVMLGLVVWLGHS